MRKAMKSGDHGGLCRLAHQMKGAGGSYGYPKLTEVAKVLEKAVELKDDDACMLALDKLAILCRAMNRGRKM